VIVDNLNFPSDESETTKAKKYRNAGLRKDWNTKPALSCPVVVKPALITPGFELGGLNDNDISGTSHIWVQPGILSTALVSHMLTHALQLAVASKAEHTDRNAPKPKVCDRSSDLTSQSDG
jgi:hypothetical protein